MSLLLLLRLKVPPVDAVATVVGMSGWRNVIPLFQSVTTDFDHRFLLVRVCYAAFRTDCWTDLIPGLSAPVVLGVRDHDTALEALDTHDLIDGLTPRRSRTIPRWLSPCSLVSG